LAVVAYAGTNIPAGFFECNGQAVSRTTYADLFTAIGTTYGAGDNVNTFNVPDMRGEFIRGKSDTRPLGSKQAGSFASHTHTSSDPGHGHTLSDPGHAHGAWQDAHAHGVNDPGHYHGGGTQVSGVGASGSAAGAPWLANTDPSQTYISIQSAQPGVTVNAAVTGASAASNTTGIVIGGTGGAETVPQNIAQIYIIKAVNDYAGGGGGGTGTLTGVTSSDPNMIAIDNTDPAVPLLDIQANVAEGIPKLGADGRLSVAQLPTTVRERLTANRTYYVRTDGSDSNNGLTNTSGGAFLTIQAAVDLVVSTLEIPRNIEVTIKLADGTYTGATTVPTFFGNGSLKIEGNTTTPGNVIISTTSATAFYFTSTLAVTLTGMKITTTTSGYAIVVGEWSSVVLGILDFGAAAEGHIAVTTWSLVVCSDNYVISGGAPNHIYMVSNGRFICTNKTVTLTGTPNFSSSYVKQSSVSTTYLVLNTYSGSATGKRYDVAQNSICESGTTLPGGTDGTVATGGQYI